MTVERVAMAAKWDETLTFAWICKGSAACGELLREADETLEKAREQEAAETRFKKLEDGRDKLVNLANTMHKEVEDKTHKELIELNKEILYNKGNVQSMAQMLLTIDNPDIVIRAQLALDEANEAANKSCV